MTDVSSRESGVNTVSLHSCSCLRYPSLVTLFVPVEHLESWHRSPPMWPLCSQMALLGMAWTSLEWLGPKLDWDGLIVIIQETSIRDKMAPCCDQDVPLQHSLLTNAVSRTTAKAP